MKVYLVAAALVGVVTLAGCAEPSGASASASDQPSSPTATSSAPHIVGTVTKVEGQMILVEEQPGVPDAGRKAWVGVANAHMAAQPAQLVGKRVKVWITGPCAESYPEQCTGASVELA